MTLVTAMTDEAFDVHWPVTPVAVCEIVGQQDRDSATAQLETLPATAWVRKKWLDAVRMRNETTWERLPEEILDDVARGFVLYESDLEVFSRLTQRKDLHSAVAATRVLGLWAEDFPAEALRVAPVLEKALTHEYGRVRAAAAEAIWSGNLRACAPNLLRAADAEPIDSVRETMLHLHQLLAKG